MPNDIHWVSANISDTEPVRFRGTFLCDHDGARTVPVSGPEDRESG